MLVLTRGLKQKIVIGDQLVTVTVLEVKGGVFDWGLKLLKTCPFVGKSWSSRMRMKMKRTRFTRACIEGFPVIRCICRCENLCVEIS